MSLVKIRISTVYYALSGSKMRSFATRVLIIELRCYIFPGHHIISPLEVLAPKSFFSNLLFSCCLFGMSLDKMRIYTFYYAPSGRQRGRGFLCTRIPIIEIRCYIFPGHLIIFPLEVLAPKSFFLVCYTVVYSECLWIR